MSFVLLWYTGLYFRMVFQEFFSKTTVTSLYGVLLVPSSQYCTSLRYHVVLLSIIMLYFCPSQYCTSVYYHICIFHHDLFPYFPLTDFIIFLALHVKVALPKLNTCTSCRHCVYFLSSSCVLPTNLNSRTFETYTLHFPLSRCVLPAFVWMIRLFYFHITWDMHF
jgi:hypothetical protein